MSSYPETINLIDRNPDMVAAWEKHFSGNSRFNIFKGEYLEKSADCIVSPANSFGFMGKNLDAVIRKALGNEFVAKLQKKIIRQYHGELLVGCAVIIETGVSKWPYMISAPTMRLPEDVSHTVNAYLAFRAVLLEVYRFNEKKGRKEIKSLICPGFATGAGKMSKKDCAFQMYMAYEHCIKTPVIKSFKEMYTDHIKMRPVK